MILNEPVAPDVQGGTILVVDDEPDDRELLVDLLSTRGHRVLIAGSGHEALSRFDSAAGEIDLVLLDWTLPDISGMEVCGRLKGREAGRLTPVIMVTARSDIDSKVSGLEGGAEEYVTKPINTRELAARIESMLRIRRQNLRLVQRREGDGDAREEYQRLLGQASRLASIGEMLSEVVHEINNPLNGILNYAELLEETAPDGGDDVSALHRLIVSEARRIQRLVAGLMAVRREVVAPSEVDLSSVLDHVLELTRYPLRRSGVALELEVPAGSYFVVGDAGRLVQVFLNLVHNALHALDAKFGHKHGKMLSILARDGAHLGEARPNGVVVIVRDNGTGISDDVLSRIFHAGFTTKKAGEGTGLGLSISRSIVLEHHGHIDVRSTPGEGTEFQIWFPTAPMASLEEG